MNLAPLRDVYLAQVSAEVAETAASEESERLERLAAAAAEVEQLVAAAKAAGMEDAAAETRRALADARRQARATTLAAQREMYDRLRRDTIAEVRAIRGSPRYPALLDRLTAELRSQLGETAMLEVDPDPQGGVIARDGSRLIDCSLPALAERCLAALGPRIEELWR